MARRDLRYRLKIVKHCIFYFNGVSLNFSWRKILSCAFINWFQEFWKSNFYRKRQKSRGTRAFCSLIFANVAVFLEINVGVHKIWKLLHCFIFIFRMCFLNIILGSALKYLLVSTLNFCFISLRISIKHENLQIQPVSVYFYIKTPIFLSNLNIFSLIFWILL